MRWAWLAVVAAACGDNSAPQASLTLVGHSDLGARGMNGEITIAGQTAYVGSRIDQHGVAIVDIADPAQPKLLGEFGQQFGFEPSKATRSVRSVADASVLIVTTTTCGDPDGCSPFGFINEGFEAYDITKRAQPNPLVFINTVNTADNRPGPHDFFLYLDPSNDRIVLYYAVPPGPPTFEVFDLDGPQGPTSLGAGCTPIPPDYVDPQDVLSSISASDDGMFAYLSYEKTGLFVVDMSEFVRGTDAPECALLTPMEHFVHWTPPGAGPHASVRVPGRPLLVVTEEVAPPPFGDGCPWGHVRLVDVSDPTEPFIVGEYALPENDPAMCAQLSAAAAYTARVATATENLALVSWYAGGLQILDISDPVHPRALAEFRPDPIPDVETEDPVYGGGRVEMWSYPIIANGLIYVIDSRNGLYVLRYDGWRSDEISQRRLLEGDSNIGAYLGRLQ